MKLASYSPDVMRLRRVAKACAAGELSRSEYRRARREVIGNLTGTDHAHEDTVPRFDADLTVRRDAMMPVKESPNNNRLNLLWVALLFVVLGALTLPGWAASAPALQNIPPVQERSLDPALSKRLAVRALTLRDSQNAGAFSISEANTRLAAALDTARKAHQPDANGFTQTELDQVARFLNVVGIHDPNVVLSPEDLSDLQALVQRQKDERKISLAQIESVALEVQAWLRGQGYPLAVAYVPAQEVRDQVVELAVELGVMEDIEVTRLAQVESAGDERWASQFENLVGEPVQGRAVESQLNIVNRVGAETLQAAFVPGQEVGGTELMLRVTPAKKYSGSVQVDNYGLDAFGRHRLSALGSVKSLASPGDRLDLRIASALADDDYVFGGVSYVAPRANLGLTFAAHLDYADFQWRDGVAGKGLLLRGEAIQTFAFTRTERRELSYSAGLQDFDWQDQGFADQQVWYLSTKAQGHKLWDSEKISLDADLGLTLGGVNNPFTQQDDTFSKLSGNVFAWKVLGRRVTKLVLRSRLQWSPDHLPAGQQIALSHAFANAGLEPFEQGVDSLVELGTQLHFQAPVGDWWWFVDAGFAQDNDVHDTRYQLITTGFGWRGDLYTSARGRLSSQITLGHPLVHKSNGDLADDGTQIYWSLRYSH